MARAKWIFKVLRLKTAPFGSVVRAAADRKSMSALGGGGRAMIERGDETVILLRPSLDGPHNERLVHEADIISASIGFPDADARF